MIVDARGKASNSKRTRISQKAEDEGLTLREIARRSRASDFP